MIPAVRALREISLYPTEPSPPLCHEPGTESWLARRSKKLQPQDPADLVTSNAGKVSVEDIEL